jgi:hypothetical protein
MDHESIIARLNERKAQLQQQARDTQIHLQLQLQEIDATTQLITGTTTHITARADQIESERDGHQINPSTFFTIGRHLICTEPGRMQTLGATKQQLIQEL